MSTPTPWKFANATHQSVMRSVEGGFESRSIADQEIAEWMASGGNPEDEDPAPTPTQREADLARYARRAEAKDKLMAEMAADNMERVRSGVWSVSDLVSLMSEPAVKTILEMIGALSFELAADSLADISHPLITPEIKAKWIQLLQSHFYI